MKTNIRNLTILLVVGVLIGVIVLCISLSSPDKDEIPTESITITPTEIVIPTVDEFEKEEVRDNSFDVTSYIDTLSYIEELKKHLDKSDITEEDLNDLTFDVPGGHTITVLNYSDTVRPTTIGSNQTFTASYNTSFGILYTDGTTTYEKLTSGFPTVENGLWDTPTKDDIVDGVSKLGNPLIDETSAIVYVKGNQIIWYDLSLGTYACVDNIKVGSASLPVYAYGLNTLEDAMDILSEVAQVYIYK